MKKFKNFTLILAASFCLLFNACEKDDHPSPFPSAPDSFYPPNGAVISETSLKLNASGSIVDSNNSIHYAYYLGTDTANMNERSEFLKDLTPGTKYYWKAVPYTWPGDETFFGDESEIFHFYIKPAQIKGLESDNCEGQSGVILRWEEPINYDEIKITFTPGDNNVEQPIIIPAGQDTCTITGLLDADPDTREYIKYTFSVEPVILATDKELKGDPATISEIPLDKLYNVRDIDFNVYRLITIGDQVWMRDNLAVTRFNDGTKLIEGEEYVIGSESDKYGVYYDPDAFVVYPWKKRRPIAPKGFRVAEWDDWKELFIYLGAAEDELNITSWHSEDYYLCDESKIGQRLKSEIGWDSVNGVAGNGTDFFGLSITPGGFVDRDSLRDHGVGQTAILAAYSLNPISGALFSPDVIKFTSPDKGFYHLDWTNDNNHVFANFRCIKEK